MDDATPPEILSAVLEAAHLRRSLRAKAGCGACGGDGSAGCDCTGEVPVLTEQQLQHAMADSRTFAKRNAQRFMSKVTAAGWQTRRVLLSTNEKVGFTKMSV